MTINASDNPSLLQTLRSVWTLLFGIGILWVASGLLGSLLGVRAEAEGFKPAVIGLIMSGFYVGFLAGSLWTPRAVRGVGHVRVFAAMSAIASVSILLHALFIDEIGWWVIRFTTGFCYAGVLIVVESWLNDRTPANTRGQVMALYMAVSFGGVGGSQLLLNLASSQEAILFMVVSILISLAVVPLLLHATPQPKVEASEPLSIRELVAASPLGMFAMLVAGLANGSVFGMAAVYARSAGFSISDTALLVATLTFGAAALQWPIGRLSDYIERRKIIALVALSSVCVSLLATSLTGMNSLLDFLLVFFAGGLTLSIHSLALSYTNDHLEPSQLVSASSGMVLVVGVGSVIGPMAVGAALALIGPAGFFIWLAFCHGTLAAYALWRMMQRAALPDQSQSPYVFAPLQGTENSTVFAEEPTKSVERE